MANYWMHNGFLEVEGRKMSKSEGNFVTIRELLETEAFGGRKWQGPALRLAMLKTHYRQPIDWTVESLFESQKTLADWSEFTENASAAALSEDVLAALSDDLNTPRLIATLHSLRKSGNASQLYSAMELLGIERVFAESADLSMSTKVETLLDVRAAARARKDFKESDRIRDELAAMGVVIKDSKEGTSWEIAR
jgi:cysteinyl-tRNA synthetase